MAKVILLTIKSKTVFRSFFWWYAIERWTQNRTLIKTWLRWFKRVNGMQKNSTISTWHITIYCRLFFLKYRKSEQAGFLDSSCALCEKLGRSHIHCNKFFFQGREMTSFQEYHYRWWKMGLLWQCSMHKVMDCQGQISAANPKDNASWKKNYTVYMKG